MKKFIILITGILFFMLLFTTNNITAFETQNRIQWEIIYNGSYDEYITAIDVLDNNSIIQGGHRKYGSDWRPFIRYSNETGIEYWAKEYNGETGVEEEYIFGIKYYDGFIYASGSTNGDAMLLKVNINGTQIYKQRQDDFGDHINYNWNSFWGLIIQNGYIYCSGYAVEPSFSDVIIANYSLDGTLNNHENYNFAGNSYNYNYDLKEYNNNQFLLLGRTIGTYTENFIMRIDKTTFNVYNNYDINSMGEDQYPIRYDVNETGSILVSGYTINSNPLYNWNYTTWLYDMNTTATNGSDWDVTWIKTFNAGKSYDIIFDNNTDYNYAVSVGYGLNNTDETKILTKQYANNGTFVYGCNDITNNSVTSLNMRIAYNNTTNYIISGFGYTGNYLDGIITNYRNVNITEIIEDKTQPEINVILPEDNQTYENRIGLIIYGSHLTHIKATINNTEINETEIYNETGFEGYNFGSLNITSYEDGNYTLKFYAYNELTNLTSNYTYINITKFIPPDITDNETTQPAPIKTYGDLTWYESIAVFVYENWLIFMVIGVGMIILIAIFKK